MNRKKGNFRYLKRILLYLGVGIGVFIMLAPFLWMVLTSLKTNESIYTTPIEYLPQPITFGNYHAVFFGAPGLYEIDFISSMGRSLAVAASASLISIIIGSLAGYSFSRFSFRGKNSLSLSILLTQMIPPILFVVPLFFVLKDLGLYNALPGLILAYITFSLPISIFLLRGYFKSIPVELEESAFIDGASRLQAFFRIIFPLAIPGIMATGIYVFIMGWVEFLFAFLLCSKYPTLPVAIYRLVGQYCIYWGHLMAASVIAILPVLLFLPFQKYLVAGLTTGAVKQ